MPGKPGAFDRAAAKVARKQGIPAANARAIIAAGDALRAPAAIRKNPDLLRVSGVKAPKGMKK